MKYHLQVNGHVVKSNLTRTKAFEYFDLVRLCVNDVEVSVLCTPSTAFFEEDSKK